MKLTYDIALRLFNLDNSIVIDKNLIKKRYKKLILKYHPDKNNNSLLSNKYTQIINDAYTILNNNSHSSSKDFLINILNVYTYTGDYELDNYIENSGKNLFFFIDNLLNNNSH